MPNGPVYPHFKKQPLQLEPERSYKTTNSKRCIQDNANANLVQDGTKKIPSLLSKTTDRSEIQRNLTTKQHEHNNLTHFYILPPDSSYMLNPYVTVCICDSTPFCCSLLVCSLLIYSFYEINGKKLKHLH